MSVINSTQLIKKENPIKNLLVITLVGLLAASISIQASQETDNSSTALLKSRSEALLQKQISLLEKKFKTIILQEQDFEKQMLLIDRNDYIFKTVQKVSKKLRGIAYENLQILYVRRALLRESLKALRTYPYAALLEDTDQSEKKSYFWYNKLRRICRK